MAELSTREKEIAVAAWRCFPADEFPKIDYEALAKAAGINTVKTASNTWGTFKKKLSEADDPTHVDLTERELSVARVGWLCTDGGNIPKINAAVMVEMGLFKTTKTFHARQKEADPDKTATNTWWSLKKKLQAGNLAAAGPSTAAPKTGKRKAAAAAEGAADAPPATKKPRKARKTKASSSSSSSFPTQEKEGAAKTAEETAVQGPPATSAQDLVDVQAYLDAAFFAAAN